MDRKEKPVLRASDETHRQLKVTSALTGESMQKVLARIIEAEYERVRKESVVK